MTPLERFQLAVNRRTFLGRAGFGIGGVALASLIEPGLLGAGERPGHSAAARTAESLGGLAGLPHIAPKAKRVIFLYMSGGPSHLETYDYKPRLVELDGTPMPESVTKGQPIAQLQGQ